MAHISTIFGVTVQLVILLALLQSNEACIVPFFRGGIAELKKDDGIKRFIALLTSWFGIKGLQSRIADAASTVLGIGAVAGIIPEDVTGDIGGAVPGLLAGVPGETAEGVLRSTTGGVSGTMVRGATRDITGDTRSVSETFPGSLSEPISESVPDSLEGLTPEEAIEATTPAISGIVSGSSLTSMLGSLKHSKKSGNTALSASKTAPKTANILGANEASESEAISEDASKLVDNLGSDLDAEATEVADVQSGFRSDIFQKAAKKVLDLDIL